jgi:hypothetical protein
MWNASTGELTPVSLNYASTPTADVAAAPTKSAVRNNFGNSSTSLYFIPASQFKVAKPNDETDALPDSTAADPASPTLNAMAQAGSPGATGAGDWNAPPQATPAGTWNAVAQPEAGVQGDAAGGPGPAGDSGPAGAGAGAVAGGSGDPGSGDGPGPAAGNLAAGTMNALAQPTPTSAPLNAPIPPLPTLNAIAAPATSSLITMASPAAATLNAAVVPPPSGNGPIAPPVQHIARNVTNSSAVECEMQEKGKR